MDKRLDFSKLKLNTVYTLRQRLKKYRYIFLTGSGGVGKSWLIKALIKLKPKTLVLGSTNLASNQLSGSTVARMFKLYDCKNPRELNARIEDKVQKLQIQAPRATKIDLVRAIHKDLIEALQYTDLIIIDEISILSAEVFELFLYQLNRFLSPKQKKTMQILIVGDFFQLPPVKAEQTFTSALFDKFYAIELQEIKRTSNKSFIEVLLDIREGSITEYVEDALEFFQKRYVDLQKDKQAYYEFENNALFLYSTKNEVKEHNNRMVKRLGVQETLHNEITIAYKDDITEREIGTFVDEQTFEEFLEVKVCSKIVFIASESIELVKKDKTKSKDYQPYYNGLTGIVLSFGYDKLTQEQYIEVETEQGVYKVKQFPFQLNAYKKGKNNRLRLQKRLEVLQFPLVVSFAITTHKAQGMSISGDLVIDASRVFLPQQFYVAISRCAKPNRLYIKGLNIHKHISVYYNVKKFYKNLKSEKWVGY